MHHAAAVDFLIRDPDPRPCGDQAALERFFWNRSRSWFLARYYPVRDDKGRIMGWYVAGTDIEDRKRAEDRLRSENVALREEIDKISMFEEIVGTSPGSSYRLKKRDFDRGRRFLSECQRSA